jgi:hypothetical protein
MGFVINLHLILQISGKKIYVTGYWRKFWELNWLGFFPMDEQIECYKMEETSKVPNPTLASPPWRTPSQAFVADVVSSDPLSSSSLIF